MDKIIKYFLLYLVNNNCLLFSLNVRIVLLVRDPRGTIQSRRHRTWCAGNPDCDNPSYLCDDLVDDYEVSAELLQKYPNRFK